MLRSQNGWGGYCGPLARLSCWILWLLLASHKVGWHENLTRPAKVVSTVLSLLTPSQVVQSLDTYCIYSCKIRFVWFLLFYLLTHISDRIKNSPGFPSFYILTSDFRSILNSCSLQSNNNSQSVTGSLHRSGRHCSANGILPLDIIMESFWGHESFWPRSGICCHVVNGCTDHDCIHLRLKILYIMVSLQHWKGFF